VDVAPDIKEKARCPGPGIKAYEAVKAGLVNSWRPAQVHSVGTHGARTLLQAIEDARKEANLSVEYIRGLRMTMEHNPALGTLPDVMAGIKKYGIILNPAPAQLADVPNMMIDYGREPIEKLAMPVKSWIDQGIRVTLEANGNDMWTPIHTLVTRKTPVSKAYPESEVVRADQAIDRVTALKMETTWAAEYMMAEDTLGTLEPAKYADFVVIDKDFFTVPVEEIPKIKAVLTGLNGKIVYGKAD
jgi:predicted amidohydrolase YtcJ